jgi:uncharacterized membrane protein YkgB
MVRALTIRFGIMAVGMAIFTTVVNLTKPDASLVMLVLIVYLGGGGFLIGRYAVAHGDEIPVRVRDPHQR